MHVCSHATGQVAQARYKLGSLGHSMLCSACLLQAGFLVFLQLRCFGISWPVHLGAAGIGRNSLGSFIASQMSTL